MRTIEEKEWENLKFNGIVVGVNKEDKALSFIFECAYYSEGKHGYPTAGYHPSKSNVYKVHYDTDFLPRGFFFNCTSRASVTGEFSSMHFDSVNYYLFEDMEEFCKWYLETYNGNFKVVDAASENKKEELPMYIDDLGKAFYEKDCIVQRTAQPNTFTESNLGSKLDKMVSIAVEGMSAMDLWRAVFNKMTKPAKRQLMNELLNNCLGNGYSTKPYIFGKED